MENLSKGVSRPGRVEIREIIECHGKSLEITEILECHDKCKEFYFISVLQFDFTNKPGDYSVGNCHGKFQLFHGNVMDNNFPVCVGTTS